MVTTKPGVQKPHCEPWCSTIARWTGCGSPPGPAMPSTVRTARPWSWGSSRMQALSAHGPRSSVTMTEQAPQSPSLQPSLVPRSPRSSRSQSSRVRVAGARSIRTGSPLRRNSIVMAIDVIPSPGRTQAPPRARGPCFEDVPDARAGDAGSASRRRDTTPADNGIA